MELTFTWMPDRDVDIEISANPAGIKSIRFHAPDQIRSRKVFSRSNACSAGKNPSWKMGRMLHWGIQQRAQHGSAA
jgi:hypothetical protein